MLHVTLFVEFLRSHPQRTVWAMALVQALLWTLGSATALVRHSAPRQLRSGETSCPPQVKRRGIAPPSSNAVLMRPNGTVLCMTASVRVAAGPSVPRSIGVGSLPAL